MAMDIISTYKYLLCFCKKKKNWELNKFLNIKIVIYKIIISFRLIGLIFFVNAVDCDGKSLVGPRFPFALDASSVWYDFVFFLSDFSNCDA